jgi:glutamate racemase
MKIGFFDSGVGGLLILSAVRKELPDYDYIFYGDTKNVPYGNKAEDEILRLTQRGVETLFDKGATLVIVACNTASVGAVRSIQDTMDQSESYKNKKVLGVIIPTVEIVVDMVPSHVTIIGTAHTISSKKYEKEILSRCNAVPIDLFPTPELASLIENGLIDQACDSVLKSLRHKAREDSVLVLGCTHYSILKNFIRGNFGFKAVVSQDEIIPEKVKAYLETHRELERLLTRNKILEIIFSGEKGRYQDLLKRLELL